MSSNGASKDHTYTNFTYTWDFLAKPSKNLITEGACMVSIANLIIDLAKMFIWVSR